MKNRKNLFYIGMFAICVLGFAACGDDETYDVYGDPYNRVYILDNSKEYKIVQTPVSTVSNVDFTWEARCSKKASGDIRVTVAVDNSLIDIMKNMTPSLKLCLLKLLCWRMQK